MYQAVVYQVFVASPGDVIEERKIIREVLDEWNIIHSAREQKVLLPVGWDTHSYSEMGAAPQDTINKQVLYGADLLIGVFWARLGTPTDKYLSGTVEEYYEHIDSGKPAMLYFSKADIPQNHDSDQFKALQEFKKEIEKQKKGLYKTFSSQDDFRNLVSHEIQLMIDQSKYFSSVPSRAISNQAVESNYNISEEEKQILIRSHKSNSYLNIIAHSRGRDFKIGVFSINERAERDKYNEFERAFRKLCTLGLLVNVGNPNNLSFLEFALTEDGINLAKQLIQETQ